MRRAFFIMLAVLALSAGPAAAQRVALVLGNGAYPGDAALPNPPNDARALARLLREQLGFTVLERIDATLAATDKALDEFRAAAQGAEVALFFFAGHGMEIGGDNLLLPVDAQFGDERQARRATVDVKEALRAMQGARVRLLLLDACRDNPLERRMRTAEGLVRSSTGATGGLAEMARASGTIIAYATAPGRTASDGRGGNSPFTRALLRHLPTPGEDIRVVLGEAAAMVQAETRGAQVPWTNSGLTSRFALVAGRVAGPPPQPTPVPSPVPAPPPPPPAPAAQRVFRDCAECPEMVTLPLGWFVMGSPAGEVGRGNDEGPQRTVQVTQSVAVGKYEVTFAEWDACVAAGGCSHRPGDESWGRGRRPVINVSWDDAQTYVSWLSDLTKQRYRLLTEAEWEYAARAGTVTAFSFGSSISPHQANHLVSGLGRSAEVGRYPANAWGLRDMHGNVYEWVEDCYLETYSGAPEDAASSVTSKNCSSRVLRGGSWLNTAWGLRSADRIRYTPDFRKPNAGFRVARTPGG
jgi:formylglycine-generating enzyme required for sulfatase activity